MEPAACSGDAQVEVVGSAPATSRAFVLTGGASLGSMQAGMLEALYAHGIQPDLIIPLPRCA
jgi:predicted acylesterase/phospholipase RssA